MLNLLTTAILSSQSSAIEVISDMDLGLLTTILGLAIVFAILIVIALLLAIFSVLVKDRNKAQEAAPQQTSAPGPRTVPVAATNTNEMDDKELVAVITAAIAASMNTSADTLVVRRIRRAGSWNKEAIEEQQNSFY